MDCRDTKKRVGMALGGEALKVASGIRTQSHPARANRWEHPQHPVHAVGASQRRNLHPSRRSRAGPAARIWRATVVGEAEAIRTEKQQRLADLRSRDAVEWEIRVAETYDHWGGMLVAAVEHGNPTCDLTSRRSG